MKIDFPLNTELPLRGGGVAVLYEFFDGHWYGRRKRPTENTFWGDRWLASGRYINRLSFHELDLLSPKRKAWVVWVPNEKPTLFWNAEEMLRLHPEFRKGNVFRYADGSVGCVQEIFEP